MNFSYICILEKRIINVQFCKYFVVVSKHSSNMAVISELGWLPLYVDIKTHMFIYCLRLMQSPWDLLKSAYKEYKNGDKKKHQLLLLCKIIQQ